MKQLNKAVLILSHCGYSFVEDLTRIIRDKGMESIVLSSLPLEEAEQRITYINRLADKVLVTDRHNLNIEDIENVLNHVRSEGRDIVACITVWEGYRDLMADVNSKILLCDDINCETVLNLRDKLLLRNNLTKGGFSQVKSELLSINNFLDYKNKSLKKFIKPRYGIASFGAFSLKPEITWDHVENVKNQIKSDAEYQSVFGDEIDLIIEDYIQGEEYSFEIIVFKGRPYVLAIHEKIEVQEEQTTLLENACTSPPINLVASEIHRVVNWLESIFHYLNIHSGCFHVEAKKSHLNWEIIEINPRVGGAYISQSVELLTNGHNLLDLWLECMLAKSEKKRRSLRSKLYRLSTLDTAFFMRNQNTFFRVFFATKKGIVKKVNIKNITIQPHAIKSFIKSGQKINQTSREVFIGQAIWHYSDSERNKLSNILNDSKNIIEVIYE